ncbi:MAG TPA: thioesterase family protein [Myxococcaceae bacterium]|nr:thioesterase family protein [Myxococcaceae bacterium]
MFQARVRVIYGDTDQMGVVYYANYLRYFELARSEFLLAHGRSYRDMEAEGLSLPVVEATCRYVAPARYEDILLVGIEVPTVTRVTLTFRYEVTREGAPGVVLCTGTTVHACLGKGGRPARLPDWVAALRVSAVQSTA